MIVSLRMLPSFSSTANAIVRDGVRATGFDTWSKRDDDGMRWVYVRVPDGKPTLDRMLRVLQRLNVQTMREAIARGVRIPSVYELHAIGKLQYVPEPKGREWWQTWIDNILEGVGDCEDLATHESSRDEVSGVPSQSECIRSAPRVYHAIVRKPDGRIDDPSMPLGLWKYRLARRLRREGKVIPCGLPNPDCF